MKHMDSYIVFFVENCIVINKTEHINCLKYSTFNSLLVQKHSLSTTTSVYGGIQ